MAAVENKLDAQVRTSFGKGAARKIRANDQIPAVLYGHGTDPQHIILPGHETMLLLRRANALIELNIEGTKELSLVKDVQRDPVRQIIEHVDLLLVKKGEQVEVEVPVHVVGEPYPGTIVVQDATTIAVLADATSIPEFIEVSVEGLVAGSSLAIQDVKLPAGSTLPDAEVDIVLLSIQEPQEEVEEEAGEAAEGEDAAADAE
ncbi:50S ribosomal protein L25/general stress protein Ctc [Gulosibacter molinativorax]|uniref:Large ribosomal subunit protein bL25 n=1 Tax=Gulosibacter molinativorax TaxID=256821 RepID=A0ABT7C7W7_9MICO|nr:50S ribosomal protein L25/general stress protein Ctc [Gulosibacter molinativorax]MDJ1370827.1 50S ribosomal protein L25 [Gulosibacter molinativorax]QUY62164.1 50S ribosomal protein L25 [Gulosibacter molinativorax]